MDLIFELERSQNVFARIYRFLIFSGDTGDILLKAAPEGRFRVPGSVPGVPGTGQMSPEISRIGARLRRLEGDNPKFLTTKPLMNLESNLAALGSCFNPLPLGEVTQHPPLREAALLHASPKSTREDVHPAGVTVSPMTAPAKELIGAAFGIKFRSMLVHPATHPLQSPVGLVGRRRRLKVSKHRLGEGHGSLESLLLRLAEHPLRGVGISRCDDGDRRQVRSQSPGRFLL